MTTSSPTPRYARIRVKTTDPSGWAWPTVERVPGGWQSGAHNYPDADVLDVEPLHARRLDVSHPHELCGILAEHEPHNWEVIAEPGRIVPEHERDRWCDGSATPRASQLRPTPVIDAYTRPGYDRAAARAIHAQAADQVTPITSKQIEHLLTIGYMAGVERGLTDALGIDTPAEPAIHPAYGDPTRLDTPTARMTPGPTVWQRINGWLAHLAYRTK